MESITVHRRILTRNISANTRRTLPRADDQGNWVALTTTVNTAFGSKVVVPGTGVILNDQMDDFSIQPGVANAFKLVGGDANAIAPGKRPCSCMSPTIVLKGDPTDHDRRCGRGAEDHHAGRAVAEQRHRFSRRSRDGDGADRGITSNGPPDELWVEDTFAKESLDSLKAMGLEIECGEADWRDAGDHAAGGWDVSSGRASHACREKRGDIKCTTPNRSTTKRESPSPPRSGFARWNHLPL